MLSSQEMTGKLSNSKKRPLEEISSINLFCEDEDIDSLNPDFSQASKKEKKLSPDVSQSRFYCQESLDEAFDTDNIISLARPKVPSPTKPKSPPKHGLPCLANDEEIIAWIVKNKRFLIASFKGKLEEWVNNKLKAEPSFISFKIILEQFVDEFHIAMQTKGTVDVRKLDPVTQLEREDLFPDVYACFVDSINGITYDLVRNTDILSNSKNSLLREFLFKNKLVAECLAYGFPTLNDVVALWLKENSAVNLWSPAVTKETKSPQKSLKAPPSSPGKSPVKIVQSKKQDSPKRLEVPTSAAHSLLANSMASFLTHVNGSGSLRKPISSSLAIAEPQTTSLLDDENNRRPSILRRKQTNKKLGF